MCHPGLNPLQRKRGKEDPFFHLQRCLVVSSNSIKSTIFKCFVTSVNFAAFHWTRSNTAASSFPGHCQLGSQQPPCSRCNVFPWDFQEQFQFKPARQATARATQAEGWDLEAACTKYSEKHLLDFKLHILVQNMKAMCASEGLKWPMKINPVLLHYTSEKPKTLEG